MSMSDRELKWRLWKFAINILIRLHIKATDHLSDIARNNDYIVLMDELELKIQEEQEECE